MNDTNPCMNPEPHKAGTLPCCAGIIFNTSPTTVVTGLASSGSGANSSASNPPEATPDNDIDEILLDFRKQSLGGGTDPQWNSASNTHVNRALRNTTAQLTRNRDIYAVKAQIEAIELLHWKYKELNGQSLDMKFVDAYTITRDELVGQLAALEGTPSLNT